MNDYFIFGIVLFCAGFFFFALGLWFVKNVIDVRQQTREELSALRKIRKDYEENLLLFEVKL